MQLKRYLLISYLACLSSLGFATTNEEYRETYKEFKNLVESKNFNDAKAQSLLNQLKNYQLYPFARYQYMVHKKNVTLSDIRYIKTHIPELSTRQLLLIWFKAQLNNQNWQSITNNSSSLPTESSNYYKCGLWLAKINLNQSLVRKPEFSQQVEDLWLSGNKLPNLCNQVFSDWILSGNLSQDSISQKGLMALKAKSNYILNDLIPYASDAQVKEQLNNYKKLLANPLLLLNDDFPCSAEKLQQNPSQNKEIMLAIFPAFVKALPNDSLGNFDLDTFNTWKKVFQLTPQQQAQWNSLMLTHIFDSRASDLQKWRDQMLTNLNNDKLTERRIRLAISRKQDFMPWIKNLSPASQNKQEWQYWQAFALEQQGDTANANQIWQNLSTQDGFYAMLSAQKLDKKFTPTNLTYSGAPAEINSKDEHLLDLITELYAVDEHSFANTLWVNLLENKSHDQKLAYAKYANEQQWYDLQVSATILASAKRYLSLRFPNAYSGIFEYNLKDKDITKTFAMAIARQESAWKPYVKSHANAFGLMQLLPSTASRTNKNQGLSYSNNEEDLFKPSVNIMLGVNHLQELYNQFGNNRILMAAAYNAGAHRVNQWLGRSECKLSMPEFVATIPFYETRNYVQNVLMFDYYYQLLNDQPLQKFTQEEVNRCY